MEELDIEIITLINGAILGAISTYLGVLWQRGTHASNEVFNLRVTAVREIWAALLDVQSAYVLLATLGLKNWQETKAPAAKEKLNLFRNMVELNKTILPPDVIDSFLAVDSYLHSLLFEDDVKPSRYFDVLNSHLQRVSTSINGLFRIRSHKIELRLGSGN